jgi:hypothetical protein
LSDIWSSAEAASARRRIAERDCPSCWVECETYREIKRDRLGLLVKALRAVMRPETAGIV